jgi:mannose-6-phosphate isomerase-like protein (cupin superfamily)
MLLSQETGDVTRNTGLYYISSAVFLLVISLVSFFISSSGAFNKIAILVIGLLIILAVIFFMRKSGASPRAKILYAKLKEHYKDDIDDLFLPPDSSIKNVEETSILEKYASRINSLKEGFNYSFRLVTVNKSKKNEMQVTENNEWWYCLEGRRSIIMEDKDIYFFQPNGIVPITKGTKFTLTNKNQQPLQVVVLNQ